MVQSRLNQEVCAEFTDHDNLVRFGPLAMVHVFCAHQFHAGIDLGIQALYGQSVEYGLGVTGPDVQAVIREDEHSLGFVQIGLFQVLLIEFTRNKMQVRIIQRFFLEFGDQHDGHFLRLWIGPEFSHNLRTSKVPAANHKMVFDFNHIHSLFFPDPVFDEDPGHGGGKQPQNPDPQKHDPCTHDAAAQGGR